MNVLIVVDRSFARQEPDLLARLEIGLADEGVRVVHALPHSALGPVTTDSLGVFTTMVVYQDRGLPFTTGQRAQQLLESALSQAEGLERLDLIHVFGQGAWPLARELGTRADAPVLLEAWRADLIPTVERTVRTWCPAGVGTSNGPSVTVPDSSVRSELSKRMPGMSVLSTPWGVHAPSHPRGGELGESLSITMLLEMRSPGLSSVTAALEALAELVPRNVDLMLFVGGRGADDDREGLGNLWRHARRLGLLERMSMVPELEGRRAPILQTDFLLMPSASGSHHTLALDAMAAGMCVVALADPLVDYLIEGRTARLVHRASADAWRDVIGELIEQQDARKQLRVSAWDYVRSERSASAHVRAVLKAYDAAVAAHRSPRAGAATA